MKKRTDMATGKRRGVRAIGSSRLTNKSQATVPASVRQKLNLKPGDTVVFDEAEHGTIRLRKAEPLDIEFLSARRAGLS